MNKKDIIQKLTIKDDKQAYEYAKKIVTESSKTNKYLNMIPDFANMLQDKSSFIRTRFFILICSQARWAKDGQIQSVFEQMKVLLNDPKPTVVRQCLNAIKEVVVYCPELCGDILKVLDNIDLTKYKESMALLIEKDIENLTELINEKLHH